MITPTTFWSIIAFVFGVNIGSFLNVVIWRLPRGGSLIEPEHSYCPSCMHRLTAIDLVPLFSFLFLGRRCRTCKQPISWRYFSVELLTGLLFFCLALRFPQSAPDAVSLMLFTALLVPMTFIDLDFFFIPCSLNLLAFAVAVGWDIWGIVQHEPNHALEWGWLPRSIIGALAGILIFGGVRLAGWIWKRQEAMGLGDVYLARAMGAMLVQLVPAGLPLLRLFPAWVLFSCLSGLAVGIPMIVVRKRQEEQAITEAAAQSESKRGKGRREAEQENVEPELDEEPSTLAEQLKDIGWVIVLGDLMDYVGSYMRSSNDGQSADDQKPEPAIAEEDFTPQPTAIPFGPFLTIGFLATVFAGEVLTAWYLAVALPKPGN
jgi:leader peptidase (prepilin peptidase)/N-methyltransferase